MKYRGLILATVKGSVLGLLVGYALWYLEGSPFAQQIGLSKRAFLYVALMALVLAGGVARHWIAKELSRLNRTDAGQ
jgi:hypothetical protein